MSSYSDWARRGVVNRNWQILQQLLVNEKINKIIAVDFLPHTFKRGLRVLKEDLLTNNLSGQVNRLFLGQTTKISDKLVIYSTILSLFSVKKLYQQIANLAKSFFNQEDFIIWSFYPLAVNYFDQLEPTLKVFDAVDNWSEHPSLIRFKNRLLDNYKIIDQKADIIFTVSNELENLFAHKEKIHWVPNGVDLKHFQKDFPLINRDIGHIPHPIIGYIGTIQERFDVDLVEYLAISNPEKSLVLVGPVWQKEIKDQLAKFKNVYFLGRKSYEASPMYIHQFEVGIIPHKIDKFIKSTNPMKIYDYLACGKPVVSTQSLGLPEFLDFVAVTTDYQKFQDAIVEALRSDSDALRRQRIALVKEHSWLKRSERMLEIIFQKL
ncbi:MAG: glycosyltransferase [Patescibacteria group bacterium]